MAAKEQNRELDTFNRLLASKKPWDVKQKELRDQFSATIKELNRLRQLTVAKDNDYFLILGEDDRQRRIADLEEEIRLLQINIDIYKSDFEEERAARASAHGEKDELEQRFKQVRLELEQQIKELRSQLDSSSEQDGPFGGRRCQKCEQLKQEIDIYKSDFEEERAARASADGEKDGLEQRFKLMRQILEQQIQGLHSQLEGSSEQDGPFGGRRCQKCEQLKQEIQYLGDENKHLRKELEVTHMKLADYNELKAHQKELERLTFELEQELAELKQGRGFQDSSRSQQSIYRSQEPHPLNVRAGLDLTSIPIFMMPEPVPKGSHPPAQQVHPGNDPISTSRLRSFSLSSSHGYHGDDEGPPIRAKDPHIIHSHSREWCNTRPTQPPPGRTFGRLHCNHQQVQRSNLTPTMTTELTSPIMAECEEEIPQQDPQSILSHLQSPALPEPHYMPTHPHQILLPHPHMLPLHLHNIPPPHPHNTPPPQPHHTPPPHPQNIPLPSPHHTQSTPRKVTKRPLSQDDQVHHGYPGLNQANEHTPTILNQQTELSTHMESDTEVHSDHFIGLQAAIDSQSQESRVVDVNQSHHSHLNLHSSSLPTLQTFNSLEFPIVLNDFDETAEKFSDLPGQALSHVNRLRESTTQSSVSFNSLSSPSLNPPSSSSPGDHSSPNGGDKLDNDNCASEDQSMSNPLFEEKPSLHHGFGEISCAQDPTEVTSNSTHGREDHLVEARTTQGVKQLLIHQSSFLHGSLGESILKLPVAKPRNSKQASRASPRLRFPPQTSRETSDTLHVGQTSRPKPKPRVKPRSQSDASLMGHRAHPSHVGYNTPSESLPLPLTRRSRLEEGLTEEIAILNIQTDSRQQYTNEHAPFDEALTCTVCNKVFRVGETLKCAAHIRECMRHMEEEDQRRKDWDDLAGGSTVPFSPSEEVLHRFTPASGSTSNTHGTWSPVESVRGDHSSSERPIPLPRRTKHLQKFNEF